MNSTGFIHQVNFFLSLFRLQHCKKVHGVEIVQAAIGDAFVNAQKNNIKNVSFNWGNSDDHIEALVDRAEGSKVLAIFDPPRAGLRE